MNKLLVLFIWMIIFTSCGENHALKEETFYFSDEYKGWVLKDSYTLPFIMVDDNGITQSFSTNGSSCYFDKGWSSFLGINTNMTFVEYCYISFGSTYFTGFSLSLRAGTDAGTGDVVTIGVGDISFSYDLKEKTIVRLDSPFGNKSKNNTGEGYEENEPILSTVVMIDSLTVNGFTYQNVVHFILNDFKDHWEKYTLTEVFVAKGYGLIKYVTHSGLANVRKM